MHSVVTLAAGWDGVGAWRGYVGCVFLSYVPEFKLVDVVVVVGPQTDSQITRNRSV